MRRRLCLASVVVALAMLAGCDVDRLPQSPNALNPSSSSHRDTPMTGEDALDDMRDAQNKAEYVQYDPL